MTLSDLRRDAVEIFRHALSAVDPYACVQGRLVLADGRLRAGALEYGLAGFDRIIVVGAGKAAAPMARAVEDVLADRISAGLVITKYGHAERLRRVAVREAGHPLPDGAGIAATDEIIRLLSGLDERTLVICLLSGGGSALLVSPAEGITLEDKVWTAKLLLASGAAIGEINAVRKHLSRVKGGRLAALASPAPVVTLVLSDVVGDRLDVIASGPTAPDESTYRDAMSVLETCGIAGRISERVLNLLRDGAAGNLPETPKPGSRLFDSVQNEIIGSLRQALAAAEQKARTLGYGTVVLTSGLTGEAREVATVFADAARQIRETSKPVAAPACVLAGGETTVTVRGDGKGGRNQEMALAAAIAMDGLPESLFLSAGTDGTDGPTDAAGAFADGSILERAESLGLKAGEHLARNDSYTFFKRLGDLFVTGPTKTNVMDIQILLVKK